MTRPVKAPVDGLVEPGWGGVADAFATNFEHGDVGAACCVYSNGVPVVDLVGGTADVTTDRPWDHRTIALVFSTTKGATAVCANRLIQQGRLDPDETVASYWPEFAANGKNDVLVRHVLSHAAGLPVVEGNFTLADALAWEPVVTQLARQSPRWEPGTGIGYHLRTFGWLVGEIVQRITGTTLGTFFAAEVARPLGLDWWIGLPEVEEPRVARIIPPETPTDPAVREFMDAIMEPGTLMGDALTGPGNRFHYDDMWNTRALHECELPSSNGIASAHAVARMYAALVGPVRRPDGARVLDAVTIERARATEIDGRDLVLGFPMRYGFGFSLGPTLSSQAGPGTFGHSGAGGSIGLADVDRGIGFGYVMNRMRIGATEDPRAAHLLRAVNRAVDDAAA